MKNLTKSLLWVFCLIVGASTGAWGATGCHYRIPTPAADPHGVSYDGLNNYIWFTERAGDKIGFIDVSGPACTPTRMTEFKIPAQFGHPVDIAVDLNRGGSQVWFSTDRGYIGMLDVTALSFLIYPIPGNPRLDQIRADLINDLLWFAEGSTSIIGSIPLGGGLPVTEYRFPASVAPDIAGITTDFNGDVWFTSRSTGQIGRFSGGIALLWPTTLPALETVTADPANPVIWATTGLKTPRRFDPMHIVKLDYAFPGTVSIYKTTAPGSHPYGIRVRTDGLVAVGEEGTARIGLIDPSVTASPCFTVVPVWPREVPAERRLSDARYQFPATPEPTPVTPVPYNSDPIQCEPGVPALRDYPVTPATPGPRLLDLDWNDTPWFGVPSLNVISYLLLP